MKTTMILTATLAFSTSVLADTPKPDAGKKAPPKEEVKPAAMPMPKAPQELADMAKAMGNGATWKCAGKGAMDPMKPTEMAEMKGTYKGTLDLDKFFIKGEWTGAMGKMNMKGLIYTTYDGASKKWWRASMDNMGGAETSTSTGMAAGKMVWEGEMHAMGMTMKTKSTEEMKDKEFHLTSEMSMDGKKWITGFEMTCKK